MCIDLDKMRYDFVLYCYHFIGSSSSPDEDRLLKHLFDPAFQPHNLMTTPIANINETISVTVGVGLRKIVAIVKTITLCLSIIGK